MKLLGKILLICSLAMGAYGCEKTQKSSKEIYLDYTVWYSDERSFLFWIDGTCFVDYQKYDIFGRKQYSYILEYPDVYLELSDSESQYIYDLDGKPIYMVPSKYQGSIFKSSSGDWMMNLKNLNNGHTLLPMQLSPSCPNTPICPFFEEEIPDRYLYLCGTDWYCDDIHLSFSVKDCQVNYENYYPLDRERQFKFTLEYPYVRMELKEDESQHILDQDGFPVYKVPSKYEGKIFKSSSGEWMMTLTDLDTGNLTSSPLTLRKHPDIPLPPFFTN